MPRQHRIEHLKAMLRLGRKIPPSTHVDEVIMALWAGVQDLRKVLQRRDPDYSGLPGPQGSW